jgi:two-component system, OmpR family, sensor histidine kinase VicK
VVQLHILHRLSLPVPTPDNTSGERTEVIYGVENVTKFSVDGLSLVENRIDVCGDYNMPSVILASKEVRKGYFELSKRGIKIRWITDVIHENISSCKEIMKIAELRHIDGVKGGFVVADEKVYVATALLQSEKPVTQLIYSNVKAIVEQQQYMFNALWSKAIPAERKIREIEEGIISHETKIIENPDEIVEEISRLTASSNKLDTSLPPGGMQYSYKYFFDIKKKLLEKQRSGEHEGIRYVTNIDKDNIQIAKIYLKSGIQIRHVRNLPPMSFGVSDKKIAVTIEKMEEGNRVQSLLMSNEPLYVKHFTSIFEELWRNGIDASDRIRNIEEGVDLAEVEVIENPKESVNRAINISNSAKEELSVLFSTPKSFYRQVEAGLENRIREYIKRRIRVRLLIPFHKEIADTIEQFKRTYPQVYLKSIDASIQTKMAIVLADRKECLLVETRDDTKDSHELAAGISIYSNSKSIVSSYAYIFDSLWRQSELYEQVKSHDKMQKEFIDIAAHELRTPIQPILGLSEVLQSRIKDSEQISWVNVISRNARRLHHLTEDILDVSRIESQTLKLHKEKVNLNEKILNVINDAKNQISNPDKLKIIFSELKEPIYIEADKGRLYQIITNILNNAIKFTVEGTISISAVVKDNNQDDYQVFISVKDTGAGIDPEILPKLFTKFTTRSNKGTGLGLFLSKSIVEAHGGRIWAENNLDGKGATFSFSLPIIKD